MSANSAERLSTATGIANAVSDHAVIVTVSGHRAACRPAYKWVNTILSKIKGWILGTYRAVCR